VLALWRTSLCGPRCEGGRRIPLLARCVLGARSFASEVDRVFGFSDEEKGLLVRSMNTPARSTIGLAVDCQWTTSGLAAPTGIPGLDTIARCGFYRGGIHEVHGNPGAGKTNIVNQMLVMPRPARKPFSSRVD
jgi:hypothetical protein